ncbi:MAG: glycerol-3-phosphate acyltransferase [Coriobacteriia bacterium]|nr:glycerol-3-phosphate acyltransferase [Coriobacteriia bacterium]
MLPAATLLASLLLGSVPSAYLIVRAANGEDVTDHGSGNVGAMNVRRSTGSWKWFVLAMVADVLKGVIPVAIAKVLAGLGAKLFLPTTLALGALKGEAALLAYLAVWAAAAGALVGHNYSIWMALIKKEFRRTGKGLATGGGALLVYDWRLCVAVVVVGLATIAITRYMMAGQVAAALTLPVASFVLRSHDWPFTLLMGMVVYAAHHQRFIGLLRGKEPELYVNDQMGPRG